MEANTGLKLSRKDVIQLVKIKKTMKDEKNTELDRAKLDELKKQLANKTKKSKLLAEAKKILKKAITFEARKIHKKLKVEKEEAKLSKIKELYETTKKLSAKELAEELLNGEYTKVIGEASNSSDPLINIKKNIFSSKTIQEFMNKLPKEYKSILKSNKHKASQDTKSNKELKEEEEVEVEENDKHEHEKEEEKEEEEEDQVEGGFTITFDINNDNNEEEDEELDSDDKEEEESETPVVITPELSSILDKLNQKNSTSIKNMNEEDVVIIDPEEDVDSDLEDLTINIPKDEAFNDDNEEEQQEEEKPQNKEKEEVKEDISSNSSKSKNDSVKPANKNPTKTNNNNNNNGAGNAPATKKRNRLGQNARKKLAQANEEPSVGYTNKDNKSFVKEDKREVKRAKTSNNNNNNNAADPTLHPSWQAKKEKSQPVAFVGKKIKFD